MTIGSTENGAVSEGLTRGVTLACRLGGAVMSAGEGDVEAIDGGVALHAASTSAIEQAAARRYVIEIMAPLAANS